MTLPCDPKKDTYTENVTMEERNPLLMTGLVPESPKESSYNLTISLPLSPSLRVPCGTAWKDKTLKNNNNNVPE